MTSLPFPYLSISPTLQEQKELEDAERLKQEMYMRRMAYDNQISSATKLRRQVMDEERETENRRLQKLREMMEHDYYNSKLSTQRNIEIRLSNISMLILATYFYTRLK